MCYPITLHGHMALDNNVYRQQYCELDSEPHMVVLHPESRMVVSQCHQVDGEVIVCFLALYHALLPVALHQNMFQDVHW